MPLALQARLLRVIQDRQVIPLGGAKAVAVDVSIICATHRDLHEMIAARAFREDLYYRLNGLTVKLPALREREDLVLLAQLSSPSRRVETLWHPISSRFLRRFTGPGMLDSCTTSCVRHVRWPGRDRHCVPSTCRKTSSTPGTPPPLWMQVAQCGCQVAGWPVLLQRLPVQPRSRSAQRHWANRYEDMKSDATITALRACGGNISNAAKRLALGGYLQTMLIASCAKDSGEAASRDKGRSAQASGALWVSPASVMRCITRRKPW